jgi:hypothetical protein
LKTRFHPQDQSPITIYSTLVTKSSTSFSLVVSIGSAKGISSNLGLSTTCVSFTTVFGVLKTSKACVIVQPM